MRRLSQLLLALVLPGSPLAATDYRPNLYDDPSPDGCTAEECSLREAILAANASAGPDRILLSAGFYAVQIDGAGEDAGATGDFDVTDDLEIVGPAATMTAIEAGFSDRALHVFGSEVDFAVRGVAITNGASDGFGVVLLIDTVASAVIEGCHVGSTHDPDLGNDVDGAMTIRGGSVATIRATTFYDNGTHGLDVEASTATIENSTFGNSSRSELVAREDSQITCTHCTFFSDFDLEPELYPVDAGSTITLVNSLVVGGCDPKAAGTVIAGGGNLESPGTTCGLETDGIETPQLQLPEIDDFGGPTPTILPDPAGVSIDEADDTQCLATDQRGLVRPEVDCDVGATEEETNELVGRPETPIFHDSFEQGNPSAWVVPA